MPAEVHDRSLTVFVLVSLGMAWLVCLPLWAGEGLESPYALVLMSLMMVTPALAAAITLRVVERDADPVQALLLRPTRPVLGFIGWLVAAHVTMALLVVGGPFVGAVFGVFPLDVAEFSGLRAVLLDQLREAGLPAELPAPMWVFAPALLPQVFLGSLVNTVIAAGEEIGWRGYLFPRLLPFGRPAALLLQGVIWGLWHAPVLLLGYNYGDIPGWVAVGMMTGFCTVVGALLAWVTERTGTIWPAAVAHGTINAAAGAAQVALARVDAEVDPRHATLLGWSGWLLPAIVALLLWWRWAPPLRPISRLS